MFSGEKETWHCPECLACKQRKQLFDKSNYFALFIFFHCKYFNLIISGRYL